MSRSRPPSREEILGYFSELSNWGRWGDEDELGTLNLITEGLVIRCCSTRSATPWAG